MSTQSSNIAFRALFITVLALMAIVAVVVLFDPETGVVDSAVRSPYIDSVLVESRDIDSIALTGVLQNESSHDLQWVDVEAVLYEDGVRLRREVVRVRDLPAGERVRYSVPFVGSKEVDSVMVEVIRARH